MEIIAYGGCINITVSKHDEVVADSTGTCTNRVEIKITSSSRFHRRPIK